MRLAQYGRQEKAIAAAETSSIRERWLYGLRLLRDSEKMAASGKSLKHGMIDPLIQIAKSNGRKLSEREIQWRLRCARAYPTETQIRNAVSDFDTWHDLVAAGFPPYEAVPGESPADHRTDEERKHDRARALAELGGDQLALFPLDRFEPATTTLKELAAYAQEMAELTARFQARDRDRQAYVDRLIAAVDGDLGAVWQTAHERAYSPADVIPLRVVAA